MAQSVSTALLIGVSDYSAYDRSVGNAVGTSNLFSPHNNLRLSWEMVRALGFTPSEIGLLSSPLTSLIDARPGIYGAATRQMVLDAVAAMARRLASSEVARGTIHFSGHGGSVEDVGPVIAVSDTVAKDGQLTNYVALSEIVEILVKTAPGKPVTVVLDSCGSGLFPRTHGKPGMARLRTVARLRDCDILLSSTAPHQVGAEVEISGQWYGALTWAISQASYQYYRRVDHNMTFHDLSTQTLFDRAVDLMRGLSLTQTPQLTGRADTIVLQPSGIEDIKPTNRLRDGGRGGLEINESESGIVNGDEVKWVRYQIVDFQSPPTPHGYLITTYNCSVNGTTYADIWNTRFQDWPARVQLVQMETGSNPLSNIPGTIQPMYAFPPIDTLTTCVPQDGDCWRIGVSSGAAILGYMAKSADNTLTWYITSDGACSAQLLSALPSPNGEGGQLISAQASDTITLTRVSPHGNKWLAVEGFNVQEYA